MARSKRRLFVKTTFAERVDLDGKTVIVTGASPRSLGFETARTLAEWGANVVITTRRNTEATLSALSSAIGQGEGAKHPKGHPLDLCDADSVVRFVQWYLDTQGDVLDVLVNNAGVHLDLMSEWKEPQLTEDGFEIHWRTNYLGTMHLTHLLLPALRKAAERSGEHSRGSAPARPGSPHGTGSPTPINDRFTYATPKQKKIHVSRGTAAYARHR